MHENKFEIDLSKAYPNKICEDYSKTKLNLIKSEIKFTMHDSKLKDVRTMIIVSDILDYCEEKKLFRISTRSERERKEIIDEMSKIVEKFV